MGQEGGRQASGHGAGSSLYSRCPDRQFWKLGVAGHDLQSISNVYRKRFDLAGRKIATAGSCFAQHITRVLRNAGFSVLDKEPPPAGLGGSEANRFGYLLYSARYGNIYTARRLLQLAQEAFGQLSPDPTEIVWSANGRFFDSLRPGVEPNGLPTPDEVLAQRKDHLRRVRAVLTEADILIFTFGLTEAWTSLVSGLVYATAPGVVAGTYDPAVHGYRNFRFQEIYDDFVSFRTLVHSVNPGLRFLVTVSPVPLTATAEDQHVLTATVRSKSVLRAVAAQLYEDFEDVDYFPSYDLLSTPFLGPSYFEENRRNVSAEGVSAVMRIFLSAHLGEQAEHPGRDIAERSAEVSDEDVACEDVMLEGFAGRQ